MSTREKKFQLKKISVQFQGHVLSISIFIEVDFLSPNESLFTKLTMIKLIQLKNCVEHFSDILC